MSRFSRCVVAGHITPSTSIMVPYTPKDPAPLARFCAWGGHWMSDLDAARAKAGAAVTHTICDKHQHLFDGPNAA